MSYDLYLFEPVAGEEPTETLERLEEREAGTSPGPAVAARNRRIADDLLAANSDYTEAPIAGAGDELELVDENGLQITLSDQQAWINFPYWESLDAERLAAEIATASRVIGEATGWRLYDPQLDRFRDPVADADDFAKAFGVGVGHVERIAAEDAAGERPSFWQRLFGRR